jgi:hypothetical protein
MLEHHPYALRITYYALCLVFAAVLLGGCDWLGNKLFSQQPTPVGSSQTSTPGGEPTASPVSTAIGTTGTPGATPEGVRVCGAGDLQAVAGWEGATGSMAGGVSFVNKGRASCVLQGRPGIHLTDDEGNMLPVANLEFSGTPRAGSLGPVVLRPGERAFVFFVWSNWCGESRGPFNLAVALPDEGGQITVPARNPEGKLLALTPRCDNPSVTSTISIGPFEKAP